MEEIQEIVLSGEKLSANTNNLEIIASIGSKLYEENKDFIKEKVKDNWFVVIEPISGLLMAFSDQVKLFEYAKNKFPDRLFYSVGLLKDNLFYYG